jgi:cytoskeletal protein RodZ
MFHASSLLKNTRLDKEWDLIDISKKLKVPVKYLEALENGEVVCYPQEPYCSLIIKDYADYLGLNGKDVLALFRRDFEQKNKVKKASRNSFSFTPKVTFTMSIILVIIIFVFYLTSEYYKFHLPPKLKVNWPLEATVSASTVEINGITDSESTIRINDDLIMVNNDGSFQKKINLNTGENLVTIQSTSPNGKTTIEQKTINSAL